MSLPSATESSSAVGRARGRWISWLAVGLPVVAYRAVEWAFTRHQVRWHRSVVRRLAAVHVLPPLTMTAMAGLTWRLVPPLPNAERQPSQPSTALAAGIFFGTLAAVVNLIALFASLSGSATIDPTAVAFLLHAVVLAPISEELAFRGLLYRRLRCGGMSAAAASVVAATIFAAMHSGATQAFLATGLGLAAAVVYEQTRTLLAPMVVHAMFNAVPLAATFARQRPYDLGPLWLGVAVVAITFSLAAGRAAAGRR